ncbi:hypothetical protein [Streptomyces jumonjinensis]|uniref:Uncharacterized protein n=1 Tax=Streptomyces jumonjinensis TaxID=1945 RepID=A0A646KTI3_STRJU|nr:hypothetical protein [Streptomyces jumonjinensis]MQT05545.1 hypothetical protein [Streptomyces jumonjinensis]
MGTVCKLRTLARSALALLAGAAFALSAPGTARAVAEYPVPAPTPDGISATLKLYWAIVPQPYDPDPTAAVGERRCELRYHEYGATEGCGGFQLDVYLHNVRNQPHFSPTGDLIPQVPISGEAHDFRAVADMARTFHCLRPDGGYDPADSLVVRQIQEPVYKSFYYADATAVYRNFLSPGSDLGPKFHMNFPPVQVNCPPGTQAHQYGLKVSNIKITVNSPHFFGSRSWSHPGPYYA